MKESYLFFFKITTSQAVTNLELLLNELDEKKKEEILTKFMKEQIDWIDRNFDIKQKGDLS